MKVDLTADRYDRQRLITWWNQERLQESRVLVVGAGAIGNEVIKNLALLGVGHIDIVDVDHIEFSNLARCVLFRAEDEGKPKAHVAAAAARSLNPDIDCNPHVGNVMLMGLGTIQSFDLVIGALDNREARRWVNQAVRKLGMAWIDGAIEGLSGVARMFLPTGPCYECTLGEVDYALIAHRQSCTMLSAEEMQTGRTPTTATTGSLIAAIEVQEAIKALHGREDLLALAGKGFIYQGDSMESYVVEYSEDPDCPAHDTYGPLIPHSLESTSFDTLGHALHPDGSGELVGEFEDEIVVGGTCATCDTSVDIRLRLPSVPKGSGACPTCEQAMGLDVRQMTQPGDELWSVPLTQLGYGDRDVATVRTQQERRHFVLVNRS